MCAIVGIYGNENASRLASLALFSMQHRGQEATGISSSCDSKIYTKKDRGLVSDVFNEEALSYLKGPISKDDIKNLMANNNAEPDQKKVF